jgi:hypothetical protein
MWRVTRPAAQQPVQQTQTLTLADAIFPRIQSDSRILRLLLGCIRDATLMLGGAGLVTLFAQIVIRLP